MRTFGKGNQSVIQSACEVKSFELSLTGSSSQNRDRFSGISEHSLSMMACFFCVETPLASLLRPKGWSPLISLAATRFFRKSPGPVCMKRS